MQFRAVGERCGVVLSSLGLPIRDEEARILLAQHGFTEISVDLVALARECVGKSAYKRGARPSEAPGVMDCSSFTKWLYGQAGVWLPRRTVQQMEQGYEVKLGQKLLAGDLLFCSGYRNYWREDSESGVGHVGIVTGQNTVIHAADSKRGIVEDVSMAAFAKSLRSIRRYLPTGFTVFKTPPHREVETSDDFRWLILQWI